MRDFALVEMIGQRQRHARAQRLLGKFILRVQHNASVAAVSQFARIQLAEGLDQIGLTMEIQRILVGSR